MKARAVMVTGLDAMKAACKRLKKRESLLDNFLSLFRPAKKANINEAMTPQWFKEHQIKADIDTGRFPDNCAAVPFRMSLYDEALYLLIAVCFFGMFIWIPGFVVFLYWRFFEYRFRISIGVLAMWIGTYVLPWDMWPPGFRYNWMFELVCKYYSYRMIIEAPLEAYNEGGPSIYCFGPHGVFPLAIGIQAHLNGFLTGRYFHLLGASVVFYVPIFNISARMMSYRSVDKKSFKSTLAEGRSVGKMILSITTKISFELIMQFYYWLSDCSWWNSGNVYDLSSSVRR